MSDPTSRLLPVDAIDDRNRLRPIDPAWAEMLAASFIDRGQDQPIVVRPHPLSAGDLYILVAGGHRLAAARIAGWDKIRAEVRDLTALQARIVEIDENLVRHELNQLDRALFLIERKTVWEQLHPETKNGGDRKSRKNKDDFRWQTSPSDRAKRFTAEAAEKVGLSERTIRAAIELARALPPEVITLLRRTGLVDNAAELRRLAAEPAEHQLAFAGLIAAGEAPNVKEARIKAGHAATGEEDPQELLYRKLLASWSKATPATRARFMRAEGLREGEWPS